jgi:hypothetical protein
MKLLITALLLDNHYPIASIVATEFQHDHPKQNRMGLNINFSVLSRQ